MSANTFAAAILAQQQARATQILAAAGVPRYVVGPNSGLKALRTRLDRGQSAAMLIIGDSTGVGSSAWPRQLATLLGAAYPNHRIEIRDWDNANTRYGLTVAQDGGGERQHWEFPAGVVGNVPFFNNFEKRAGLNTVGRYLGYEFEFCAPTSDKLVVADTNGTTGNPLGSPILSGWNAGGSDMSWCSFGAWGNVTLNYYDSAGTPNFKNGTRYTGQCPLAGRLTSVGNYVRYKLLLDTANGANWSLDGYYSLDQGCTWTSFGASTTGAKDAYPNVFGTLASCNVGYGQATPPNGFNVSYSNILVGANYEPVLPCRVDVAGMVAGASSNDAILAGKPVLYIDNVSITGARATFLL